MAEEGNKFFALSGQQVQIGPDGLRPGDMGLNPEISTMSQLRVAERGRAVGRMAAVRAGGVALSPRMAARKNRF
jgi:hypothetical protein